jgi:hypothetical protein
MIKTHYGIPDSFPRDRLYVRVHGGKLIQLVTQTARTLVLDSEVSHHNNQHTQCVQCSIAQSCKRFLSCTCKT